MESSKEFGIMYQTQNYYQHLGTAGHRACPSNKYLSPCTPGNFYPGNMHHRYTGPFYSNYQAPLPQQSYFNGMSNTQAQMGAGGVPQPPVVLNQAPMPVQPPAAGNFAMAPPPVYQEQNTGGGVNPVLEYDLHTMATFLSWCAYGMLKQEEKPSKDFEGFVVSVLFATRLSKSTIVTALEYMNQRFYYKSFGGLMESDIERKLVIALILANKFNDDNTFTNSSWGGATGLSVEEINKEELAWLLDVNWNLNVVKFEKNIETLEECWKTWLEKYSTNNQNSNQGSPTYSPYEKDYSAASVSPSSVNGANSLYSFSSPGFTSPWSYGQEMPWSEKKYPFMNGSNYNYGYGNNNMWAYQTSCSGMPNVPRYNNESNNAFGLPNYVVYPNPYYNYSLAMC